MATREFLMNNGKHLARGTSGDPLYSTWLGARSRCLNENDHAYPGYGGRGITMHEPWVNDPPAFIAWIQENLGPRPAGTSLDRIDNDGHYEPGNLRWASKLQQFLNSRAFTVGIAEVMTVDGLRWMALTRVDGIVTHHGLFITAEDAAAAIGD